MPRAKQTSHTATTSQRGTIDISDESSDDIGTEQETTRPSQIKPKKNAAGDTKVAGSKSTAAKEAVPKSVKGKAKAKAVNEDEMEIDAVDGRPLKRPLSAMSTSRNQDSLMLAEENERLRRQNEELSRENEELRQMVDAVIAQQNPTAREQKLLQEIDALTAMVERGRTLLELRNSEYTKSKLIARDSDEISEWVTMEWAETLKEDAMRELEAENEQLRERLATSENTIKAERREAAEAKRQLNSAQRELEAEVEHSKKLAADVGRRPAPAPPAVSSRNAGSLTREFEKKVELLEGLAGIGIVTYTESIRQPGNAKSITYTCLLSLENQEFPFKLVVWDEKQDEDDESEHVVYTPGEPIDPELQLDYLAGSFTFPRSQLAVFYQNMIGILTSSREAEEEE